MTHNEFIDDIRLKCINMSFNGVSECVDYIVETLEGYVDADTIYDFCVVDDVFENGMSKYLTVEYLPTKDSCWLELVLVFDQTGKENNYDRAMKGI